MNKKEVLDALAEEFAKSLKGIDATNGDVIKMMFPNAEPIERYTGSMLIKTMSIKTWQPFFAMFDADVDWWNAKYMAESEDKE